MYNKYFGFSEAPFEHNLTRRFLFLSENHKEVLAALYYFITERKGLALVCGEVGTGKTMLIHSWLDILPSQVHPIVIPNPYVDYLELIKFIAGGLGITEKKENLLELSEQMKEALIAARQQGKDYLLIVDEAQLLSDENLEQIRLLSNIEIPEGKLLQILLVGQYEVTMMLERHKMRHLRQRININRFLFPLRESEVREYMNHRLGVVDSCFAACFEDNTWKTVYALTGGVPRLINHLCDNALLICMTEGHKKVNSQMLQKAWEVLQTDIMCNPQMETLRAETRRRGLPWRSAAACLASLVLGFALGHSHLMERVLRGKPTATSEAKAKVHRDIPPGLTARLMTKKPGDLYWVPKSVLKPTDQEKGGGPPPSSQMTGQGQSLNPTKEAALPEQGPISSAQPKPSETEGKAAAAPPINSGGVPSTASTAEATTPSSQPWPPVAMDIVRPQRFSQDLFIQPGPFAPKPAEPIAPGKPAPEAPGLEGLAALPETRQVTEGHQDLHRPAGSSPRKISTVPTPVPEPPAPKEKSLAASQVYQGKVLPQTTTAEAAHQPAPRQPEAESAGSPASYPPTLKPPDPVAAPPTVPQPQPAETPNPKRPSPGEAAANPKTHRVTRNDGNLSRIISNHYQAHNNLALAAVLLANPKITSENLIYAGQQLILPQVNTADQVITLPDGKYYLFYEQYPNQSALHSAIERLKDHQVRYAVRETRELGTSLYRVFLGGYDQEAEVKKAAQAVKERKREA